MSYVPITRSVIQYADSNGTPYSGAVLKAYSSGTSTPISFSIDKNGGTIVSTISLNANGFPEVSGNVVIPHLNETYKLALYPDQSSADANSGAIWTVDDIQTTYLTLGGSELENIGNATARSSAITLGQVQDGGLIYLGTSGGSADAYTLTPSPSIGSSYPSTMFIVCKIHTANLTTTPYLQLNGISSPATNAVIKKIDATGSEVAVESNDLSGVHLFQRNSANDAWIVLNPKKPVVLTYGTGAELTISTGAITVTHSRHTIDTESDSSSDDLDTINGGLKGQILVISTADSARDVVLKHGTGNIVTPYGADITLYSTSDRATLEYDGTNWTVLHTKKPGETVQVVNYQTGAVASSAGLIPFDNSIPQNTEGTEFMSLAITPKHEANKLLINVVFVGGETSNVDNIFTVALFKDSEANALAACFGSLITPADQDCVNFCHYMTAGSTSAITFKVRAGKRLSGNMYINGTRITGGQIYGGVAASSITITEIQV